MLRNAFKEQQMIAPIIKKDIVHVATEETTKAIIQDLEDDLYGILVDETSDVSCKE